MLDLARRKGCGVRWVHGGHEAIGSWDAQLAVMSGHVAQFFLDDVEWTEALSSIRAGLVDGGTLTFESRNPEAEGWLRWGKDKSVSDDPTLGRIEHWSAAHGMTKGVLSYTNHYRFLDLDQQVSAQSEMRFRTLDELKDSLSSAGFTVNEHYGYWDRRAVSPDAPELVIVSTARP